MTNNTLPSTVQVEDKTYGVNSVLEDYLKWHDKYDEFAQGRTNFQIEKFLGLEDGTPVHNYTNILYQTRVMRGEFMREVKRGVELQRNFDYKWAKHIEEHGEDIPLAVKDENGNDTFQWYDLEKLDLDHTLMELKLSMKDKIQQLETFNKILNKLEENNGGEFTREQYEQEAPEYWEKRFERQAVDEIISSRLGVSTGNAKSIRQALAAPILDDSPNQVKSGNTLIEKFVTGEFDHMEVIKESNERMNQLYSRTTGKNLLGEPIKTKAITNVTSNTDQTESDPYNLDEETLRKLGITISKG